MARRRVYKLRHWPPGTDNKTFVPSFFLNGAADVLFRSHSAISKPNISDNFEPTILLICHSSLVCRARNFELEILR